MHPPMNSKNDTIDADELFEAEYKLQNCIRITTEVESFTTEVYTGKRWLKVSDYVQALLLRERELGKIEVLEQLMTSDPKWTYDAAKDILIDSRDELSRLSREESHE